MVQGSYKAEKIEILIPGSLIFVQSVVNSGALDHGKGSNTTLFTTTITPLLPWVNAGYGWGVWGGGILVIIRLILCVIVIDLILCIGLAMALDRQSCTSLSFQ
jgi:hypothetical protein